MKQLFLERIKYYSQDTFSSLKIRNYRYYYFGQIISTSGTFMQSISGMLALILGALVATNVIRLWMVMILAFCLGLNNAFDNPTRQSFVVELVGVDELKNAVTLYSTLVNLARIIGPGIAGVLISTVGLAPSFFFNGISN